VGIAAGKSVAATRTHRRAEARSRRTSAILLVDDDDDVRAVAAAMLLDAGHTVIEADSGSVALQCLDRDQPHVDLLIADIAMPGMSGGELARAARLSRPELPILFISGFADLAVPGEGITEMVLQKPFHAEELNAKVAEALTQAVGPASVPAARPSLAEPRPEQ
jgi:CheY-like chemotaxis protein